MAFRVLSESASRQRALPAMLGSLVLASVLAAGCTGPPHGWIPCRPEIDQFCDNCRCGRFHCPPGAGLHAHADHAAHGGHCHGEACHGGHCENEPNACVGLLDNACVQCKCTCAKCTGCLCSACNDECCERTCACDPNCTDPCCDAGGGEAGECASGRPAGAPACNCEACAHPHHAHKKHVCPKLYDPEAGIFNFCTPPIALMSTPPPPPGRFFPVPVKPVFSPQPVYQLGYGAAGYGAGGYGAGGYGPGGNASGGPGACNPPGAYEQ